MRERLATLDLDDGDIVCVAVKPIKTAPPAEERSASARQQHRADRSGPDDGEGRGTRALVRAAGCPDVRAHAIGAAAHRH